LIAGAGDGAGVAFLLENNPSPTRERLRGEILKKLPKAMWAVYEPLADEGSGVFGDGAMAVPQLEKADVIVALDADFLGPYGSLTDQRAFATRRKPDSDEKMNRLYCVENRFTVTGGIADHRLRVPASQVGAIALELAAEIGAQTNEATLLKLSSAAAKSAERAEWIKFTAEDLVASKGRSLVLVGGRQPAAVQAVGAAINAALGNLGQTLIGRAPATQPAASIADLNTALGEKKVSTLIVIGGNPVHNAPVDLDFAAKLKDVANLIRIGSHSDETGAVAMWQVPLAHYLESWGDGVAVDGSYVSVQPMILPLFGGWSEIDVLAKFAGQKNRRARRSFRKLSNRSRSLRTSFPRGRSSCTMDFWPTAPPNRLRWRWMPERLTNSWPRNLRRRRVIRALTRLFLSATQSSMMGVMRTTAGSRNCRTRSPSKPGITPRGLARQLRESLRSSRRATLKASALKSPWITAGSNFRFLFCLVTRMVRSRFRSDMAEPKPDVLAMWVRRPKDSCSTRK
jgi:hypothetical protein